MILNDSLRRAQLDIDLPQIAVIGGQSAGKLKISWRQIIVKQKTAPVSGKSSLIEAISGIKLPRASGTCTRWVLLTSRKVFADIY